MNPENTLLGLAGNLLGFDVPKSMTSADLPTFRETAHSFMDDLIQKQEAKMSEVLYPDGKNIFGQPTQPFTRGDLESLMMGVVMPGQGAKAMTPKTFEWIKMMKDLKLDAVMSPRMRESGLKEIAKRRDLRLGRMSPEEALKQSELESKTAELLKSAGFRPKYKDAPYRATADLEDLVVKIGALMKPTAKSKMAAEYRHTIDKNLLKAMEEIERTGMSGTIHQGTESNIKNTFRALMDLIK